MSHKIRVLFALPNFQSAGSGREMFNIIERLDKSNFEPWVAVQKEGGALYDEILEKGYPILIKQFIVDDRAGFIQKLKRSYTLSRAFKPYGFHIWQSFNWSSDFTEALVARWSGAKYVYVKKNMNWDRMAWKVKSYLSHTIVARNSTLIKEHLAPRFFASKAYLVSGGVNRDYFASERTDTFRKKHRISNTAYLITCVAQLVRIKDQLTLISAAAMIENAFVVLAGANRDDTYYQELKQLTSELKLEDRVLIIGNISNVKELLDASDVFVLPTSDRNGHEEGCPVALLEAMAASVPCIASDVAGSRDLVVHGETGLLFTPGDPLGLAINIRRFKADPSLAKRLASAASRMISRSHSLETESAAFSSIYKGMAGVGRQT